MHDQPLTVAGISVCHLPLVWGRTPDLLMPDLLFLQDVLHYVFTPGFMFGSLGLPLVHTPQKKTLRLPSVLSPTRKKLCWLFNCALGFSQKTEVQECCFSCRLCDLKNGRQRSQPGTIPDASQSTTTLTWLKREMWKRKAGCSGHIRQNKGTDVWL